MRKVKISTSKSIVIAIGLIILIIAAVTLTSTLTQAQSPLTTFDFPLGDDDYTYGPILQYYGDPSVIVEDTRYGIKNPDLGSEIKCFGQPWNKLYHAGEDWYRFDKNTGQMLDTAGAVVKAVGPGKVVYKNDLDVVKYPGYAVIIEHILSPPKDNHNKIYSVYMHLDKVFVSEGDVIDKGTPLGTVLSQFWSGTNPDPNRPSYDSHLHWEMRYFFDGSNIYDPSTSCNGVVGGRGYTYPEHPNDFPADTPYVDLVEFITDYEGEVNIYLPIIEKQPTPTPTSSPTPSPTPTSIPCIEGNLIINGGLEQNVGSWPQWIQDDGDPNGNWPLIDDEKPYQGSYGIWMGGHNNADEEIYQVITLPDSVEWGEAEFRIYVTTEENNDKDWDYLYWDLKNEATGQSVLKSPFQLTNRYDPKGKWMTQKIRFNYLYRLIPNYRRVRLSISDKTDGTSITSFYIDNVKFITHCK